MDRKEMLDELSVEDRVFYLFIEYCFVKALFKVLKGITYKQEQNEIALDD